MNKKYQIEYLPIAVKDLTEIIEYIKLDNPHSALETLTKFDKALAKLEFFPYLGQIPKDPRLQSLNYRLLIVDNYLVFYIVIDDLIEIRRILHGKRKYEFLL